MDIGTMQGRLVPPSAGRFQGFPRDEWEREFPRAAEAGLAFIEWIYDVHGEGANPIESDAGLARMRSLAREHGVDVRSVCADWFMERPLVRGTADERARHLDQLRWLIGRCAQIGAHHIVLPFVDASRLETAEDHDVLVDALRAMLPVADAAGVELHLETSLAPQEFATLLGRLEHPMLRANYDSGNSASLGYGVEDELSAYGERVGSVHVKDRVRGGGTVPLGTGGADLPALFRELRRVAYAGDLVLQVARGASGDEVAWARQNRAHVERLIAAEVIA